MIDNPLRIDYLQAMGIDVWVSRHAEQSPGNAASETEATEVEQLIDPVSKSAHWAALQQSIRECQRCALSDPAIQPHPGQGCVQTEWLLITDEPSIFNDSASEGGLLLTQMMHSLGLDFQKVWMTSVVKCPVPHQKSWDQGALAECRTYLEQQISQLQPKIMLIFGEIAAQSVLQTQASLIELRGKIHKFAAISTIVTYHPHFLLQTALEKRAAWTDLQLALAAYYEVNRV